MPARNILLICGTLGQTKAMIAVGNELADHNCYYTPFYVEGHLLRASERGQLDFTVLGAPLRERTMKHLREAGVRIDERGAGREYDLVVTCTDLVIQDNIRHKRVVLVQEGLTEPEGFLYWLVKHAGVPRVFANTAAFGVSDAYEVFCVGSPGAKDIFRAKGVRDEKMVVTGIPNFDAVDALRDNDFPHRDFVLICTSNARETFKYHDRMRFLRDGLKIAAGRPVIFKLHPAEDHQRAIREVRSIVPDAHILTEGNTEQMIANCSALVAPYSTVAVTAALLGKEVHSYIKPEFLRQILPLQNDGGSARSVADVCRACFVSNPIRIEEVRARVETRPARPAPHADLHLMPQAGEQSLAYSFVKGLQHALRRPAPSQPRLTQLPSSQPVDPVD